jgi:hypothetical protein
VSWARFDDLYDDNRKVKRAFRREPMAVAVHVMSITYAARHETDGVVDLDWLEERMHDDEQRARVLAVLVDAGLFERLPAGESLALHVDDRTKHAGAHDVTLGPLSEDAYVIHDFLDYNPSSVEAHAKRRADADRKRQARDSSTERPGGVRADTKRTPSGVNAASKSPDPTRPDPTQEAPLPPRAGEESNSSLSEKRADRARAGSRRRVDLQALAAEETDVAAGTLALPDLGDGEAWERVRDRLRQGVPESTWFGSLEPLDVVARDGDTLLVHGNGSGLVLAHHGRAVHDAAEAAGVAARLATPAEAAAAKTLHGAAA